MKSRNGISVPFCGQTQASQSYPVDDRVLASQAGITPIAWSAVQADISRRPTSPTAPTVYDQGLSGPTSLPPEHDEWSTMPPPPRMDCSGELLTAVEQGQWFAGCVFIKSSGRILTPDGHRMNEATFNASYGGKKFLVDTNAKMTSNAWAAATCSTLWNIPRVDFECFRPDLNYREIITDEMGHKSINSYVAATIKRFQGDVSPFLNHLKLLLPMELDRRTLIEFLAHNAKYPGHKVPWAPLIQSTEGAGKNVLKYIMSHVMGNRYVYAPKARELGTSGAKFNAWMQEKLFIIVDEVKTDEKRELVEVLKDLISEDEIEIQAKGKDQRKSDNVANWMFFTNHKDAIPIDRNGRRWAIFYSQLQSTTDLERCGMDADYFRSLYNWLGRRDSEFGLMFIADYLLSYPIERGAIPMRAPDTSSKPEALVESRGWLEQAIMEAVEGGNPGFRNGWISTVAVNNLLKSQGQRSAPRTIGKAIQTLGYYKIGQAGRGYFQDDPTNPMKRPVLYSRFETAIVQNFGRDQGYE